MVGVRALLYALVIAEDHAPLLGAITFFLALATVMLVTRRWIGIEGDRPKHVESSNVRSAWAPIHDKRAE